MSDEIPEVLRGLPVLYFYEDPEEKRQRIDGALPAPSSVPFPRVGSTGQPGPELQYPLIHFPWEPWAQGLGTQSMAVSYASWLNETGPGRLDVIIPLFAEAGAPVARLRDDPAGLGEMGRWVQRWFPILAAPLIEQGFLTDQAHYRLGWARQAGSPRSQGYSRYLDALTGSVAHDLAFIVADCARSVRPDLAWEPSFDTYHRTFVVGIDPEPPQSDLIDQIADFLTQTAARPRGARGHELRDWYGLTLTRGYERVVHGTPVPESWEVISDAREVRGYPRRSISRPGRSDAAAPTELVSAVDKFRAAGWFEKPKFNSADVARAAQAAWRRHEGSDIPVGPDQMYWRLLILDESRTWSDDVDAGVQPGDRIYEDLIEEITYIRGKTLGRLWSAEEDWTSRPGDLLLTFRAKRGKQRLLIPSPGHYLSAAVFTGLNELAQPDEPRLWFVDQGAPIGIVTRATEAERDALEAATGLRLDAQPPGWWTRLTPLPSRPLDEPAKAASKPRTASRGVKDESGGNRRPAAEKPPAAQIAFAHLMRDLVEPAMHELGFTGKGMRFLAYRSGDYEGAFSTQKSRHSTKEEVIFWVHLTAVHVPTRSVYWHQQLHGLILGHTSRWTIRADSPAEPVAQDVLDAFRRYGWPAIQAALDAPGYPPDPAVTWQRTFMPPPTPAAFGATTPNLGPLTWPLRRTGERDDLFADVAHADEYVRGGAISDIGRTAMDDARAAPALLNRLEHDPSPFVRSAAARALQRLAGQPSIGAALLAAAGQDEDVTVRWEARYALRLADVAGE